jgi:hypothetical protein
MIPGDVLVQSGACHVVAMLDSLNESLVNVISASDALLGIPMASVRLNILPQGYQVLEGVSRRISVQTGVQILWADTQRCLSSQAAVCGGQGVAPWLSLSRVVCLSDS